MTDLRTAIVNRRSYYSIGASSPVGDAEIRELVEFALLHSPTAFNSQTGRLVLLLGGEHLKLWNIVRETLRKIVPADKFAPTDRKIDSFAAGHGTVLIYEDSAAVAKLQADFPTYADAFPSYSMHASGMLQYVLWTLLRDAGLGASLQHYGNLIDKTVASTWDIPSDWLLIAQMPFGVPMAEPGEKEQTPLDLRLKVFSS